MGDKKSVISLIAIIVIALGIVGWQFGGALGESRSQAEGMSKSKFIADMALKSEGDITKLSADEQKRVNELTHGDGERTLRFHPNAGMARMVHSRSN